MFKQDYIASFKKQRYLINMLYIGLALIIMSCSDRIYYQKRNLMILKSVDQPANKKFYTQKHKGSIHSKKYKKLN